MAINLAHRPDLDARVEKLAAQLGLAGRGRKTAIIERALAALEERVARTRPDRATVLASIDRYIAAGPGLREKIAPRANNDHDAPLSLTLQQVLYDERGLPT